MSFNLRDALNAIFMKVKYEPGDDYNQFAVNNYLSKYKQYIPILENIMCLKLSNQAHFDYLVKSIGFGWPSKRDISTIDEDPLVKYVMNFYECSRLDARDYLMFMNENDKINLKDYYEGE